MSATAQPPAAPSRRWLAVTALVLAALFWSGNFIAGRYLRGAIDPVSLNTLRWVLATAIFAPFVLPACLRHRAALRAHWPYLLALAATGVTAFNTMVYVALSQTTATSALLVLALLPSAILLGAAAIGASRPTWVQWLGTAVSLGGVAVLVSRGDLAALAAFQVNRGDLWILGAVVFWAAYSLLLQRRPVDLPPKVALAGSMVLGVGLMLPLVALTWPSVHVDPDPAALAALGYIVIFPSVLAFQLWGYGVATLGPERAGQFVNLMPVFGPVLAVAILGETIVAAQIVGALIVFAGIAAVLRGGRG